MQHFQIVCIAFLILTMPDTEVVAEVHRQEIPYFASSVTLQIKVSMSK